MGNQEEGWYLIKNGRIKISFYEFGKKIDLEFTKPR